MKIKYYGVPHNVITLRNFLFAKGIKVSQDRSERLFALYKWLIEEPRQWENVGAASHRTEVPPCYAGLKDSTFFTDVRLLARVRLVFPLFAEATFREEVERTFFSMRSLKEHMKDPAFAKSMQEAIQNANVLFETICKETKPEK